jgi:hemerythrin-like domain-containing protein
VAEGEKTRLVAWSTELRSVHTRLREALRITRESADRGADAERAGRDLLTFCHGFCTALTAHHAGEDRELFPAIAAAHPGLGQTLRLLQQDHSMMTQLIGDLLQALGHTASADELESHLAGIGAIMESHFRYEERELLTVLETLELTADPTSVLGPLAR